MGDQGDGPNLGGEVRLTLAAASDDDFAWMIRCDGRSERGFALPPGGVDETAHLEMLRGIARRLRVHGHALWMIVADGEVVGLCSYKDAPTADGSVEIGYSIAATRRRRGYATRATAALLDVARQDAAVRTVLADTVVDNFASQRVLAKNDFHRIGTRNDPIDGELIEWRIDVAATSAL